MAVSGASGRLGGTAGSYSGSSSSFDGPFRNSWAYESRKYDSLLTRIRTSATPQLAEYDPDNCRDGKEPVSYLFYNRIRVVNLLTVGCSKNLVTNHSVTKKKSR